MARGGRDLVGPHLTDRPWAQDCILQTHPIDPVRSPVQESWLPASLLLVQSAGERVLLGARLSRCSVQLMREMYVIYMKIYGMCFLTRTQHSREARGLERHRNGATPSIPKDATLVGKQLCTAPDSAVRFW